MKDKAGPARGVVLMTGTSSGIGMASAVAAAGAGFTVVATLRDPGRADALRAAASEAGVELDVRRLDITDEASIAGTVAEVLAAYGRLDAVVNNAGVGSVGTLELLSMEQIRAAFEVNFFGTIAVTRAALPHLRASRGRLVTVGSAYGVAGQPFNEPYCASKGATEVYLESLAPVAAEVGVRVSVIEPGPVSSSFVANIPVDRPAMLAGAGDYGPAFRNYLQHVPRMIASAVQTPQEVAAIVLDVLTDPAPPFRVQTSPFSKDFVAGKLADTDGAAVVSTARIWLGATHAG
ncbi:SDR family NAD(P)-dependent oxidoreductase [Streptomyces sp. NRRL B-1677]|uniref:SDR family NAD(P)-dependent oxidoreductase n=1 Tax=Streptomyces sp. NRRL B-1677 TaxID=2682966 RepID=UPI001892916B|nr:SDR family NAD(P)-dependent oxidoreductase [Streptomyces sp. NRRL B-1677]MBF6049186.1 SDR family NAD(P)-dependent oxidoreductase [Streptomyces sp. NRRL B-1677]